MNSQERIESKVENSMNMNLSQSNRSIPQYVFDLQKSLEKSNHNLQICQDALKKQLEFNIDLTEKIKDLESQVDDLQGHLASKANTQAEVERTNSQYKSTIDQLRRELDAASKTQESRHQQATIDLEYLSKDNHELKYKVKQLEHHNFQLSEQLTEYNVAANLNVKEKESLDNNMHLLNDKVNMLHRKAQEYESANNQLKSKNSQLEMEVRALDKENTDMKERIYELNSTQVTLEHNLANERHQINNNKLDLDSYKSKYEDVNAKYKEVSSNYEEIKARHESLTASYQEVNQLKETYYDEKKQYKQLIKDMKERLDSYEKSHYKLKNKNDTYNEEINALKHSKQVLQDENEEMKVINSQNVKQVNETKLLNESLKKENDSLNAKFLHHSSKERDLSSKLSQMQTQFESIINQKSTEFKSRLKNLEENAGELKSKHDTVMSELEYYKSHHHEHESTIVAMQSRVQELEEENADLKENSNELQITRERKVLKVCILETMNQVLGRSMHEVDARTLELLELDQDRVQLHSILDQVYRNHTYNNMINYFAESVKEASQIEFSQQEFIQLKNRLKDEQRKRIHLHNLLQEIRGNIRVCVRVRKLLPRESKGYANTRPLTEWLAVNPDNRELSVYNATNHMKSNFEYNWVFDMAANQEEVFEEVRPLVVSALDGYNISIIAYGQTSSGKTFSMEGTPKSPGVAFRAFEELFIEIRERGDYEYSVCMSILEVYNEKVRDLLKKSDEDLEIFVDKKNSVNIPGLTYVEVACSKDAMKVFNIGKNNRVVGSTNYNEHSSRSHLITQVSIKAKNTQDNTKLSSKLYFVDLAGSECLKKTGSEGERQIESKHINKSLCSLVDVFYALANKGAHVPYRNSKLTYLLQDSIGGDSKVCLLAHISPNISDFPESSNTLHFSSKVSTVEKGVIKKNKKK